jgi:hypothetical protein
MNEFHDKPSLLHKVLLDDIKEVNNRPENNNNSNNNNNNNNNNNSNNTNNNNNNNGKNRTYQIRTRSGGNINQPSINPRSYRKLPVTTIDEIYELIKEYKLEDTWNGIPRYDIKNYYLEIKEKTDAKDRNIKIQQLHSHTQLKTYIDCMPKNHLELQHHLNDNCRQGLQHILQLRSNCIKINEVLNRWYQKNDKERMKYNKNCNLCKKNMIEDQIHYLLGCDSLKAVRDEFIKELEKKFSESKIESSFLFNFKNSGNEYKLKLIYGWVDPDRRYKKKSIIEFNKSVRNYLLKLMKTRNNILNQSQ